MKITKSPFGKNDWSAFHEKARKEIEEMASEIHKKHTAELEKLTKEQFALALSQAIRCGDFQRVVLFDQSAPPLDHTQAVTYLPYRRLKESEFRIFQLEQVAQVADLVEQWLQATVGADKPQGMTLTKDQVNQIQILNARLREVLSVSRL